MSMCITRALWICEAMILSPTRPMSMGTKVVFLLAMTVLMVTVPVQGANQEMCFSRQHQNTIVNVRVALTKPGTAMDSRYVLSERDCVLSCCSQEVKPGISCTMAVYNPNKPKEPPNNQNCYLFHCETPQDCPLMSAQAGINTFDISKGLIRATTVRPITTAQTATTTTEPAPTTPTTPQPTFTTTTTQAPTPAKTTTGQQTTPKPEPPMEPTTSTTMPTTTISTTTATTTTVSTTTTTSTTTTFTTTTFTTTTSTTTPSTPTMAPTESLATRTTTAPGLAFVPKGAMESGRGLQNPIPPEGGSVVLGKGVASPGSLKTSLVAVVVVGLAILTLALAVMGRKAMESFDRRHYTRLELNDLHYEV
ncbi:MANSC domain-containing protein 1 isoform X2 [Hypomesus transpacificus]|uniref:MANSC domain-containing protein 1 isoform X2 n=1 Tax=Hypomesus transpacificus TaxID=137520 RepID=UPI001F086FAD|nr:MANSC domain-containing protein 1 isoform X2 [Hypomesus transpacificus]